ncbi:MAG: acetylglutamate kinase [Anaerolineae bacterium]|nr:acetylglutamate kinase [Anaerolineae bacterium]
MKNQPIIIKMGGNDLADPAFVPALAQIVAALNHQAPVVLVHGGGRTVDKLLDALQITPTYHNGQRVTDAATLDVVEMVLTGQVNKQLVLALLEAGVDALGLSGVDRGLLRVERWSQEMGLVGRIVAVRAEVLDGLCAQGVVPVISPISIGPEGRYNVNADHAAGAIAGAISAARAVFLTNVPGVLREGAVIPRLTAREADALIAEGVISGGMIPKVNAALDGLNGGVAMTVITDLNGLRAGSGTAFVRE